MKRTTPLFLCCVLVLPFGPSLRAADDIPALMKQLKDPDPVVRLKAAKLLGTLGAKSRDALPGLRRAADDDDADVKNVARQAVKDIIEAVAAEERVEALAALEKNIKDAKSDDAKTRTAAIASLTTQVRDSDDVIRVKAIQTLAEVGNDSKEIVQALLDATKSGDDQTRKVAKEALDKIQGPAVKKNREKVDALVRELKAKDAKGRLKVLDDLAAMGTDAREAGPALVEAMLDKTPVVASKAGDALEKVDPPVYKLVLTVALDRDARKREAAIDSLGKLGVEGKAAVPILFMAGQKPEHASGALQALVQIAPNDPHVRDAIVRALYVPPAEVAKGPVTHSPLRGAAIAVLDAVVISPKKSVPALISALYDPQVRVEAINALGKIGPKAEEAVPALTKLKRDSAEEVRDAASKALEKIETK
ncbi:MAG TPA: HEAT repeat domain-containing protein [Gemmataceae bacterium]